MKIELIVLHLLNDLTINIIIIISLIILLLLLLLFITIIQLDILIVENNKTDLYLPNYSDSFLVN